jgi:hypothetical protein
VVSFLCAVRQKSTGTHLLSLSDTVHPRDGLYFQARVEKRLDEENLQSEKVSFRLLSMERRGADELTYWAQVRFKPADWDLVC